MRVSGLPWFSFCVFHALVLVACGPSIPIVEPSGDEGTTGGGTSETSGSSTTAPPPEPASSSDSSDSSDGSSTDEPPTMFLVPPDGGGVSFECDFLIQDCPPGFKCNAWANDGGGSWNATKCVPIAPDPGEVGDPCTVEGSGTSGIDSCELGAMCWDVDPKTNEGVCVAYCQGDAANPFCEDPDTICEGREVLLCLPLCCPLEQDCPEGQGCYAVSDSFSCAPDASGDQGAFGDSCEFINVCDPGMVCLDSSVVPPGLPCEGAAGCCTPFCVAGSSWCSELDPTMDCMPWYEEEDQAPPGFEHTGVCVVPM
jgi:hypothetical protein